MTNTMKILWIQSGRGLCGVPIAARLRPSTGRQPRAAVNSPSQICRQIEQAAGGAAQDKADHRALIRHQVLVAGLDHGTPASELRSGADPATEPKMPPCALIMARPISWNSGK